MLSFLFILIASVYADCPNGAVRIYLPNGEMYEDCQSYNIVQVPEDEREWYVSQRYDRFYEDYGENGDPTEELEEDTSWPGQREDFSDMLMR